MGECLDAIFGNSELLPSNVSHKPAPNHQHWLLDKVNKQLYTKSLIAGEYLARNSKSRHRINDAQQCWNRLGFFSNLGLMYCQVQIVMLEVLFQLLTIYVKHVLVGDCEHSAPMSIAVGELGILGIEDTVQKGEVVSNLFVTVYTKPRCGLLNGGREV